MEIGQRLFSLRQKRGESLQQVADAVGVSKAHVWELEKGRSKNPSFELVNKLAGHFDVSVDVLSGRESEPDEDDMEVRQIHRDLEKLTKRDREIIAQMAKSLIKNPDLES